MFKAVATYSIIWIFTAHICFAVAHPQYRSKVAGKARDLSRLSRSASRMPKSERILAPGGKGKSKKQPTVSPSPTISTSPSSRPTISHAPSLSFQPSGAPTISAAPTVDTISGEEIVLDWNGYQGVQMGCKVPNNVNSAEFAEESVKRANVTFVYKVKYANAARGENVLKSLEIEIPQFVYKNYILCPVNQNDFSIEKPIGISSSPSDSIADDLKCADANNGDICVLVDAKFVLLYPSSASINERLEVDTLLSFIKDSMTATGAGRRNMQANAKFNPTSPDIISLTFVGSRNDSSFPGTSVISSSLEEEGSTSKISTVGGIFVAAAVLIVLGVLFLADKRRRRRSHYDSDLRHKAGYAEYDGDGTLDGDSDGLTPTSSPVRVKFPVSSSDFNNVSTRYQTQNVHHCKSATCLICKASGDPEFIKLRVTYETGEEVTGDFSMDGFELEPGRRGLHDEFSDRKYGTPNTVTL